MNCTSESRVTGAVKRRQGSGHGIGGAWVPGTRKLPWLDKRLTLVSEVPVLVDINMLTTVGRSIVNSFW